MPRRAITATVLASTAAAGSAWAQMPGLGAIEFPVGLSWPPAPGELNHWYASPGTTDAWAYAVGADLAERADDPLMGLADPVSVSVLGDDARAWASASVTGGKLRVQAGAQTDRAFQEVDAFSGAVSTVNYFAVMDHADSVTIDVRLTGLLQQDGTRFPAPSAAGVLVSAMGSSLAGYPQLPAGESWLWNDLIPTVPDVAHPNLQVFSHALIGGDITLGRGDQQRTFDQTFSVTASGVPMICDPTGASAEMCGKYGYLFGLTLYAAALNSAFADFDHTLEITAIHLPAGATLTFDAGQAIRVVTPAVPEAHALIMAMLGLGIVAAAVRRKQA